MRTLSQQIGRWKHPVMVHESLRQLAQLAQLPEHLLFQGTALQKKPWPQWGASRFREQIDPDRILQTDLLRWLFLCAPFHQQLVPLYRLNLTAEDFRLPAHRKLYARCLALSTAGQAPDLLTIGAQLETAAQQALLEEIFKHKIHFQRAITGAQETIQKLLEERWMEKRKQIKKKVLVADASEEAIFRVVKEFNALKRSAPKLQVPSS